MRDKKQISLAHKILYQVILLIVFFSTIDNGNSHSVRAQAWISSHQITYFQGNKAGAVSLTFDDGDQTQVDNGVTQLNARELKGTFFIITDPDYINNHVSWATWQSVAIQGHEIASHTVTHAHLPGLSEGEMRWELSTSQSTINQNITNQPCLTIAYPFAESDNTVHTAAADYYVAARGAYSTEGGFLNHYQSGYDSYYGPWSVLNFNHVAAMSGDGLTLEYQDLYTKLDLAAQRHAWFVLLFHSIPDSYVTDFGNVLDYIQGRQAYWIDTFGNISRYMKERLNSTIQVITETPTKISIRIVMDASLPTSIYNVPLTLRSTVPFSWNRVSIQQESTIEILTPILEGGEKVVYYNAMPNGGDVVLTNAAIPVTTSIGPVSAIAGSDGFTLTVTGANFVNGSIVRWNNSDRITTYISDTQLTASIPASDIGSVGTANVTVFNPAPDGGISSQLPFTITAKPIIVTVVPGQSKVYGGTDPTFAYTSSDPAANFTGALSRTAGENAGVYAINLGTLAVVGGNYVITSFVPANFTINKSTAIATLSNLNYIYDGTQKSAVVTTDPPGLPIGITYNGSSIAPTDAGSYAVTATVNHTNYAGVANGTLVIAQAIVHPGITVNNKTYDGTTVAAIATRNLNGIFFADVVNLSGGSAAFADKNVGNNKTVIATGFALSGADAGNYRLSPSSTSTTANISPRVLIITATGVNKNYDGTTAATVTLSDNRVSGDDVTTHYTTASFLDPNFGSGKTIDVSGISVTGGIDMGNYTLGNTTTTTNADITSASQTITVTEHAPATASDGSAFRVAAIAFSELPVTITTSGVCTGSGNGTAVITVNSGSGVCTVSYNQVGNINYSMAAQVQENVTATHSVNPPKTPVLSAPASGALVDSAVIQTLKWSPVLAVTTTYPAAASFQVEYATDSAFTTSTIEVVNGNTITDTQLPLAIGDLSPNRTYYWHVRSWSATGATGNHSVWSATRTFRTMLATPVLNLPANSASPANSALPSLDNKRPTFSWGEVPGATTYTLQILYGTKVVNTGTIKAPAYVYTPSVDLLPATTYTWKVRANGTNTGNYSAPFTFTTSVNPPAIPVLFAPANAALLADSATQKLDWKPVSASLTSPAAASFEVEYATNSAFTNSTITSVDGNTNDSTLLEIPTLPGRTYYWRVRSWSEADAKGNHSAWSAARTIKVKFVAPVLDSVTPNGGSPIFVWHSANGLWTNYTLTIINSTTNKVVKSFTVPAPTTTYTIPAASLPAGTYKWQVKINGLYTPISSAVSSDTFTK